MEVILLEKIRGLGQLGEKVKVKRGYGRNYLVPYGKATHATEENLQQFEQRRAALEKIAAEQYARALTRQKALEAMGTVTLSVKAGEEGKLFGSIGTRDLAEAFVKAGTLIERHEIHLPMGALRLVGEYDIAIELHSDITTTVKVVIVSESTKA